MGVKKVLNVLLKSKKGSGIASTTSRTLPTSGISKSQAMLRDIFSGEMTFGTGQNLPKVNGTLTSGGGLIKHDDMYERRTANMFGF
jgi:hypothetical protein